MIFSKWMESEFFIDDINDGPKCIKSMLLHKIAQPLANAYGNRKLPPGYSGYMRFGPKALAGRWGDLAFSYPLIMFMMGISIMVSIAGISYCVLLYLGLCGSRHACERPFQRYWRIVLCVLMSVLILISIPSLWIAYTSSFYLMLMSLDVDRPPDVKEIISQSILQYNHVFKRNVDEFRNYAMSEMSDYGMQLGMDMGYEIGNKTKDLIKEINESMMMMKTDKRSLRKLAPELEDAYVVIARTKDAIRRVYRFFAEYAEYDYHWKPFNDRLPSMRFTHLLRNYTSFDLVTGISSSSTALNDSFSFINPRLEQLPAVNDMIINHATETISEFMESFRDFLEGEAQAIEAIGEKYTSFLSEIINSPTQGISDSDSAHITVPPSLVFFGLVNCIILTLITESLIVVLIIGIIGTRGARDTFGLNKTTSSKLLVINIIIITAVFSLSALIASHHFFWAVVIENGVCNLEPSDSSEGKVASNIFLACKVPETIYTKLLSEKLIQKFSFNENPPAFDTIFNEFVTKLKTNPTPLYDNASTTEYIMEMAEKAQNKIKMTGAVTNWNYLPRFSAVRDTLDRMKAGGPKYYLLNCHRNYFVTVVMNDFARSFIKHLKSLAGTQASQMTHNLIGGSFQTHFKYICDKIDDLYKDFNSDAQKLHKPMKSLYVNNLRKYAKWVDRAMLEIGKCGLLAEQYQQSFRSSCNCLTDPLNAYWVGIFSTLLINLPIVVAGIALANLFKKVCVDYTPKVQRSNSARDVCEANVDTVHLKDYYENHLDPGL